MPDRYQQRVAERVPDRVVKFGQHGINIGKNHQIKSDGDHENITQNHIQTVFTGHLPGKIQIKQQNSAHNQHNQVDDDALTEILFERVKESPDNIRFFVARHFQCHIEHGSDGRADGDYRNTADDTENIENHQISHSSHKSKKLVVRVE